MSATPYPDHTGHHRGALGRPARSGGDNGGFPLVRHRYTLAAAPPETAMTAAEVGAWLGFPDSTVRYWIVMGWLPAGWAVTRERGGQRRYVVAPEAVWDFLADPRAFPYIDAAAIADRDLRDFASRARETSEWATPADAARAAGYAPLGLPRLARQGRVRTLRFRGAIRRVYHVADLLAHATGERAGEGRG